MTLLGRFAFCIAAILTAVSPLRAQGARLSLGDIVDGSLASGETHRYSVNALELTLVSLRVESLDGSLDPVIEIFDSNDELIHASDDYDYPATLDAAIQAFVLPKTSTYSIVVSGHAGSSGDYRLYFLPGYDVLALHDATMEKTKWKVVLSDTAIDISESSLFAVELQGFARSAVVQAEHFPQAQDLYFQATFHEVTSAADWNVGLVFRYIDNENYHRLLLSKTGFWRLDRFDNGERAQLKYWSTHPAIRPGEKDFRLGILASGQHFDAVYNGQVVGSASDSAAPIAGPLMNPATAHDSKPPTLVPLPVMSRPIRALRATSPNSPKLTPASARLAVSDHVAVANTNPNEPATADSTEIHATTRWWPRSTSGESSNCDASPATKPAAATMPSSRWLRP